MPDNFIPDNICEEKWYKCNDMRIRVYTDTRTGCIVHCEGHSTVVVKMWDDNKKLVGAKEVPYDFPIPNVDTAEAAFLAYRFLEEQALTVLAKGMQDEMKKQTEPQQPTLWQPGMPVR